MEKPINLSMKGAERAAGPEAGLMPGEDMPKDHPMIGYLAVICGILSIFHWGVLFVPMGLAFSIAALIVGQGVWGFAGLVLAVVGLTFSPALLTLLGLGAVWAYFGF